jgi:hypothetical protein
MGRHFRGFSQFPLYTGFFRAAMGGLEGFLFSVNQRVFSHGNYLEFREKAISFPFP